MKLICSVCGEEKDEWSSKRKVATCYKCKMQFNRDYHKGLKSIQDLREKVNVIGSSTLSTSSLPEDFKIV